jgi:hypothetical protein
MGFINYEPLPQVQRCRHPSHEPPNMIVLRPGVHTWQCPGCGHVTTVIKNEVWMKAEVNKTGSPSSWNDIGRNYCSC